MGTAALFSSTEIYLLSSGSTATAAAMLEDSPDPLVRNVGHCLINFLDYLDSLDHCVLNLAIGAGRRTLESAVMYNDPGFQAVMASAYYARWNIGGRTKDLRAAKYHGSLSLGCNIASSGIPFHQILGQLHQTYSGHIGDAIWE